MPTIRDETTHLKHNRCITISKSEISIHNGYQVPVQVKHQTHTQKPQEFAFSQYISLTLIITWSSNTNSLHEPSPHPMDNKLIQWCKSITYTTHPNTSTKDLYQSSITKLSSHWRKQSGLFRPIQGQNQWYIIESIIVMQLAYQSGPQNPTCR
jgi:hypothetical protein